MHIIFSGSLMWRIHVKQQDAVAMKRSLDSIEVGTPMLFMRWVLIIKASVRVYQDGYPTTPMV